MKSKKGFTLMEVIVVIGVIGILATISAVAISVIKIKSRDVQRLNAVKDIHTALGRYKQAVGQYPAELTPGLALVGPEGRTYMDKVPQNPTPMDDGDCIGNNFQYTSYENGRDFTLEYCLGATELESQCLGVQYAIPSTITAPANCNSECCYGDYICYNGSCCQRSCGDGQCGGSDGCGGTCDSACPSGVCDSSNYCCYDTCSDADIECGTICSGDTDCGDCASSDDVCLSDNTCCTPTCSAPSCTASACSGFDCNCMNTVNLIENVQFLDIAPATINDWFVVKAGATLGSYKIAGGNILYGDGLGNLLNSANVIFYPDSKNVFITHQSFGARYYTVDFNEVNNDGTITMGSLSGDMHDNLELVYDSANTHFFFASQTNSGTDLQVGYGRVTLNSGDMDLEVQHHEDIALTDTGSNSIPVYEVYDVVLDTTNDKFVVFFENHYSATSPYAVACETAYSGDISCGDAYEVHPKSGWSDLDAVYDQSAGKIVLASNTGPTNYGSLLNLITTSSSDLTLTISDRIALSDDPVNDSWTDGHQATEAHLAYDPNQQRVIAALSDGQIYIYDIDSGGNFVSTNSSNISSSLSAHGITTGVAVDVVYHPYNGNLIFAFQGDTKLLVTHAFLDSNNDLQFYNE